MGCKHSKPNVVVVHDEQSKEIPASGETAASSTNGPDTNEKSTKHHSFRKGKKQDIVYNLLVKCTSDDPGPMTAAMAAMTPEAAAYQDHNTGGTPLHMAVKLIDYQPNSQSLLDVISELILAHPKAVRVEDMEGNIPLHYAIAPATDAKQPPSAWKTRSIVVRILLAADTTSCSSTYLSRNDVVYTTKKSACSPLYRVLQCFPDDSMSQHAPTLDYLHLLLKSIDPRKASEVASVGNDSDGDKPLGLLYRRFTRQFDLAEKFFAGDNSRAEVVLHRQKYKTAAGNTWKMIEMLLLQQGQENHRNAKTIYRTVHRAVQGETPPDLLRYIVETNAQDLTVKDEAGNLPLHYAAKSLPPQSDNKKRQHFPAFYSKYVMDELLYKFPEAGAVEDAQGRFPLTLAIQSGKQWIGGGIKSLYDAYPEAIKQIDLHEHPVLKRALSMDLAAEQEAVKEEKANDTIQRDEQYDAIMLVQQPNVDISEVVTSMWAHEEDAGVQMLGCVAISRLLAQERDELRIALTAVPAVVNAMKAHPNEVVVQEKACIALQKLAVADGRREISFVASGAVAAIVGAMQAHVSDPGVQEVACLAVSSILQAGGSDRATVVASVSGLTALVNALASHPEVKGVQVAACKALLILTSFTNANLPDLPRQQTEPLLCAAQQRFPDECGEAVHAMLERMESYC